MDDDKIENDDIDHYISKNKTRILRIIMIMMRVRIRMTVLMNVIIMMLVFSLVHTTCNWTYSFCHGERQFCNTSVG